MPSKASVPGLQGLANAARARTSPVLAGRPMGRDGGAAAPRGAALCERGSLELGPGELSSILGVVGSFSEAGTSEPELQAKLLCATEAVVESYAQRFDVGGTTMNVVDLGVEQDEGESRPRPLAEQRHVLALAKPPGWTVTVNAEAQDAGAGRAQGGAGRRLQDWVVENLGRGFTISRDTRSQHGLVHRLDRDTSGVLLVAKTYRGFHLAQLQFVARRVCKEYLCLCHGGLPEAPRFLEAPLRQLLVSGEAAVTKASTQPSATIDQAGKSARTEVLSAAHLRCPAGGRFSLARLRLHTGRQHQIRAHMAGEGAPLVADVAYGGERRPWCRRIFLHAYLLGLDIGDGPLEALCRLPPDLTAALDELVPEAERARAFMSEWLCV